MQLVTCQLSIDDLDRFVSAIGSVGERYGTTVQAFDARYVVDRQHIERAVALADRSIDRGENVARDRAVEILLYAAGRRQIDRAFEMGVSAGEQPAVLLVDSTAEAEAATVDALTELAAVDAVDTEPTFDAADPETIRAFFDITDAERSVTDASIGELVRERVALLDVEK